MVRSYMRHGPTQAFGIVCSPTANSYFDGRLAFVPGWEDVLVWDVKLGEQLAMWHAPSHTSPVSFLVPAPAPSTSSSSSSEEASTFAVAYQDGSIRLWSWDPRTPREEAVETVAFNGHKKAITTLAFDSDGARLASGGTEGEIVIWDRVAEVGLFRLKGHRGPITGISFLPHPTLPTTSHPGYLVSTSKDTYLKLWDLSTQHCVQTVVVGRGEVWGLAVREEGEGEDGRWVVMTGSGDGEARVWTVAKDGLERGMAETKSGELPTLIRPLCTVPLPNSTHPIAQLAFHPTLPFILLQTSDRTVTVLRLRSEEEVNAKRARRKKRDREKGKKKGKDVEADQEAEGVEGAEGTEVKWEERVALWCTVRANAKIKSFSFPPEEADLTKGGVPLLLALSNNSVETYHLPSPSPSARKASKLADGTSPEPVKTHSIEIPGHRQDVRALAVSSDDQVIASAASGTLKIWNAKTTACLRTMEGGYAICLTFLPGDRHVVVGTKSGELMLYDIAASTLLDTYKAHSGPVWSVHVRPDGKGLVSGSADKDVKFWEFEVREKEDGGETVVDRLGNARVFKTKQLALVHVRTLKMTDDVLAVKYSPDGRLLAVALLDSTVKIFFQDTLKFFLSLYGHKLPVLSLDISFDSKLIATCSADKNVKLWGLDFGDCHRSIFAHDDSIMQVAFEKDSHYFWTVGKDRGVKYWDGDKFELIQSLTGHHGEVWALAVSSQGQFVVTGSHDKSIRIWEKTDEPLFLEEEREREVEALYDAKLADTLNDDRAIGSGAADRDQGDVGGEGDEAERVAKQTSETLMAGEKIMEALEIAEEERKNLQEWEEAKLTMPDAPPPQKNKELLARGDLEAEEHVWKTIRSVPAAGLEDALLVLPFRLVVGLLELLDTWTLKNRDVVLISRLLSSLLRTHSNQLVATRTLRPQLLVLRTHLRDALQRHKELMGYNLAGLRYLRGRWEGEKVAGMISMNGEGGEEDVEEVKKRIAEGGRKRRRVEVRA